MPGNSNSLATQSAALKNAAPTWPETSVLVKPPTAASVSTIKTPVGPSFPSPGDSLDQVIPLKRARTDLPLTPLPPRALPQSNSPSDALFSLQRDITRQLLSQSVPYSQTTRAIKILQPFIYSTELKILICTVCKEAVSFHELKKHLKSFGHRQEGSAFDRMMYKKGFERMKFLDNIQTVCESLGLVLNAIAQVSLPPRPPWQIEGLPLFAGGLSCPTCGLIGFETNVMEQHVKRHISVERKALVTQNRLDGESRPLRTGVYCQRLKPRGLYAAWFEVIPTEFSLRSGPDLAASHVFESSAIAAPDSVIELRNTAESITTDREATNHDKPDDQYQAFSESPVCGAVSKSAAMLQLRKAIDDMNAVAAQMEAAINQHFTLGCTASE